MCVFASVQQLTGVARFNNGTVAEGKIDLRFDVEDENDNPPVFVPVPPATIKESSPAGKICCFLPQHSEYNTTLCSFLSPYNK